MAPLVLDGVTLGQRHLSFNTAVNNAVKEKVLFEDIKDKEEKSDIDKLFKIDLAGKCKDVTFILQTFKSEDILYVSRAIKVSSWLITDNHYTYIVNPVYLNKTLFPQMISKASSMLMLHIRLILRDESRVEDFFKYYETKDLDTALKWLPHASQPFVDKMVEKYCNHIKQHLFKRLCERSYSVLEIFNKHCTQYYARDYIYSVNFFLKTHTEKYLDIFETMCNSRIGRFGPKQTAFMMKKCPERIINKFDQYVYSIDIKTFAKHLDKNKIKPFLLEQVKNKKLQSWFRYENIKPFIKEMPKEGKFDFLREVFIDKKEQTADDSIPVPHQSKTLQSSIMLCSAVQINVNNKSTGIYQWYRYAPFEIAFQELKKLLRSESSPEERINMFSVMLTAAGSNMKNIEMVLNYYHDRHINEPFKYKVQFVNNLISTTNTHKFTEQCWKKLDELFYSLEVYTESSNNVQNCVNSIILYKVLNHQTVSEVIGKKIKSTTFKNFCRKLTENEKSHVFNYLFNNLVQKIKQQSVTNKEEFITLEGLLDETLNLLIDWEKNLTDYPFVLEKLKETVQLKKQYQFSSGLDYLYNKKKSWKRLMFEESLLMLPSEEVCLNALKHDPLLLKRYKDEVDLIRFNDTVSLLRFLQKLRVYWPESLASEWSDAYRGRLEQLGGHRAIVRALFTLLTLDSILPILKKYAPDKTKIVWSEADELQLSLQKNIAKNMHISRPQPPPDAVLWYAKGDYLQYALPSVFAIFYNLSSTASFKELPKLLNAPVSIQKHGIRLAFTKLPFNDIKEIFSNNWKTTKNASIRAVIFKLTFKLLCDKEFSSRTEELWQLLEMFIENLSEEENKDIYNLLGQVSSVPSKLRGRFCMKAYNFLKCLPAKSDCENILENVAFYTADIMDTIDPDFVKSIILEYIDRYFAKDKVYTEHYHGFTRVVAAYLIYVKSDAEQQQRYEQIFVPLLKHVFARWSKLGEKEYIVKMFYCTLLTSLVQEFQNNGLNKNIIAPVQLYKNILKEMEDSLSIVQDYILLAKWKLQVLFVECADQVRATLTTEEFGDGDKKDNTDFQNKLWEQLCNKLVQDFGKTCIHYLEEDVKNHSPLIYSHFAEALEQMLSSISFPVKNRFYEVILSDSYCIYGYLVVISLLPTYCYDDKEKVVLESLKKKICEHPSKEVKLNYFCKFNDY